MAFYVTVMPLAALILLFEVDAKPNVLHLVAVVMLVLVGTVAVLWNLGRHYRRICICIGRQMGKVFRLAKYRYRLARATVQFVRSLRLLQKMSWLQYLALSLITLGFWLPRYLLLFLIIHLVGQAVPLSYLFLVQGALNLGSQIFLMPGGGGTVDAGYAAFLSPYLDRETLAFTLLVWRTYTFYWFLIVGRWAHLLV
jgi:glycosyltransferase 2 family protein